MHPKLSRTLTRNVLLSAMVCMGTVLVDARKNGAAESDATAMRTVTDMAKRQVQLPQAVKSVYSVSPMGDIMMYTLAPSKVAGTSCDWTAEERRYLLDDYNKKPMLGGWFGKNTTGNPEVILKAHPGPRVVDGLTGQDQYLIRGKAPEAIGHPGDHGGSAR